MESSATQDLRFRQKRQHLNFSSETSYFLPKLQIMAAQIFRNNTLFNTFTSLEHLDISAYTASLRDLKVNQWPSFVTAPLAASICVGQSGG